MGTSYAVPAPADEVLSSPRSTRRSWTVDGRNDNGNSHSPTLDTYLRMLVEYGRIMDSRERGFSRLDYLLSPEELQRVSAARIHPSNRRSALD